MKQYKVVREKITYEELGTGNFARLETVMNDMAYEGWNVVCLSPQPGTSTNFVLVTFCKDDAS